MVICLLSSGNLHQYFLQSFFLIWIYFLKIHSQEQIHQIKGNKGLWFFLTMPSGLQALSPLTCD